MVRLIKVLISSPHLLSDSQCQLFDLTGVAPERRSENEIESGLSISGRDRRKGPFRSRSSRSLICMTQSRAGTFARGFRISASM
uniref:Uncharacterized protein n=1 Tax=Ditylenchus dipsaci TaxID=166011 RepID=A0A915CN85_9BILA